MAISLDHTIVPATDKQKSAQFLATILGLEASPQWGPFVPVRVGRLALDYADTQLLGGSGAPVPRHHYAFLVSEPEFDEIFARIRDAGIAFYAEPHEPRRPGEINYDRGGRTVYFDDPDGHVMEVLTHSSA
ncbi:VOC family protein [Planosporangium thailandense]|uniref:VOC family protein n=1 Tax=Planosporangium thailandense TaxID=765197 RepID=A0ABX0Y4F1_9ACTN|nr:VOC family protein [Planosporangium thailandense]